MSSEVTKDAYQVLVEKLEVDCMVTKKLILQSERGGTETDSTRTEHDPGVCGSVILLVS